MAIRNLLVAYNGSDSSDAAVHSAALMHAKYDAHVTGLLAHRSAKDRISEETWIPDDIRETLDALEGSAHDQIRDRFLHCVDGRIAEDKLHWIERFGDADATVADYARMFDLTIMGRRDALMGRRRLELHPDRVAVKSGRPVLVVPRDHQPEAITEHAVLAWDGQRAATRALNDAMQILETKQKVTVLMVDSGDTAPPLEGIDVKTALSRHGVSVEMAKVPMAREGIARTILDFCELNEAGLLVMGAFQHSVFREELFGGVTKTIIAEAKLPVLMSH
jgi:nucleotide-binding universal stress UspA family protein